MSRCRCGEPERDKNWNLSGCEELRGLKAELKRLNDSIKTAYGMLQMYGVPELRAKSVANGIMVLVSRIDRESEFQSQKIKRLKEVIGDLMVQYEIPASDELKKLVG